MKKYMIAIVIGLVLFFGITAYASVKILSGVTFSTEFDSPNFQNVSYERFTDTKYKVVCYSEIGTSLSQVATNTVSAKATSLSCISY